MRVAVSSTGRSLDAAMDSRFGRCATFIIVETDDMSVEAVENPNVSLGGGAGIQSALLMAQRDVKTVLTGNCGPNAHETLSAAGIAVVVGCSGTVSEAIERFKSGKLHAASAPNVADHAGLVGETPMKVGGGVGGGGGGGGRGMGGGGGRGMGGGGGRGRGMGCGGGGGGGGRGMGGGGGRGMGCGGGVGTDLGSQSGAALATTAVPGVLVASRPAQRVSRTIVLVDLDECSGCGVCVDACPEHAISLDGLLVIDAEQCTGCGACIAECPDEALSLRQQTLARGVTG